LSGFRIDAENIGRQLHERGVLFCLDAIQTLGAFPLSVEHVDFLSADSHKWLLGPAGAGIVYIAKEHFGRVRPTLLGSWNVYSPDFAAQDAIRYYAGGRRYEPGMLNLPGIAGMSAGMGMLMDLGIEAVGQRILRLRRELLEGLRSQGWRLYIEARDQRADASDAERSGIVTVTHPERELSTEYERLKLEGVTASLRKNRHGQPFIRFSPHFYNTVNEIDRTLCVLGD
jgi:selenocysteine lyase/cysteine desulfurase